MKQILVLLFITIRIDTMITLKPFYFIRHGETSWNAERKLQGQTDIPLNEAGMQQAASLRERVSKLTIQNIFHSPLKLLK